MRELEKSEIGWMKTSLFYDFMIFAVIKSMINVFIYFLNKQPNNHMANNWVLEIRL